MKWRWIVGVVLPPKRAPAGGGKHDRDKKYTSTQSALAGLILSTLVVSTHQAIAETSGDGDASLSSQKVEQQAQSLSPEYQSIADGLSIKLGKGLSQEIYKVLSAIQNPNGRAVASFAILQRKVKGDDSAADKALKGLGALVNLSDDYSKNGDKVSDFEARREMLLGEVEKSLTADDLIGQCDTNGDGRVAWIKEKICVRRVELEKEKEKWRQLDEQITQQNKNLKKLEEIKQIISDK